MKIGILGSGVVAQTLGAGFLKHGHEVAIGTRDRAKLADWAQKQSRRASRLLRRGRRIWRSRRARGRRRGRARRAETRGRRSLSPARCDRRLQSDRRRTAGQRRAAVLHQPHGFADGAPAEPPIPRRASSRRSTASARRRWSTRNSPAAGRRCSSAAATPRPSGSSTRLLDQFGWDTEDMGAVEAARAIEPLCMLWCIPGVGRGDWSPHAFKLLR